MKRIRWITVLVGAVVTASALSAPVASAADDPCLMTPGTGDWYGGGVPTPLKIITNKDTIATIFIGWPGDYPPDCSGTTATVQKADGTLRRVVSFDLRDSTGSPPANFLIARIPIPLANGAGDWVVTSISHDGTTLAVSARFTMYRGTAITLAQPAAVYNGFASTVTGLVSRYTATGSRVPWAGRPVQIYCRVFGQENLRLIGTVRTDTRGRYLVRIRISGTVTFRTAIVASGGYSGASIPYPFITAQVRPRPATITGTVGATSDRVIRPGTKMSTYGHLRVLETSGRIGPFAGQRVLVQTRPRGQTSVAYSTVAMTTTTSNGYYYVNWPAQTDVDVRVAFVSTLSSVTSAFRWLAVVDVQP